VRNRLKLEPLLTEILLQIIYFMFHGGKLLSIIAKFENDCAAYFYGNPDTFFFQDSSINKKFTRTVFI